MDTKVVLEQRVKLLEARIEAQAIAMERLMQSMMESGWNESRFIELLMGFVDSPTDIRVAKCAETMAMVCEVRDQIFSVVECVDNMRHRLLSGQGLGVAG